MIPSDSANEPCIECELYDVCASERRACQAFWRWQRTGVAQIRAANDIPSSGMYKRIFSEKEDGDE